MSTRKSKCTRRAVVNVKSQKAIAIRQNIVIAAICVLVNALTNWELRFAASIRECFGMRRLAVASVGRNDIAQREWDSRTRLAGESSSNCFSDCVTHVQCVSPFNSFSCEPVYSE